MKIKDKVVNQVLGLVGYIEMASNKEESKFKGEEWQKKVEQGKTDLIGIVMRSEIASSFIKVWKKEKQYNKYAETILKEVQKDLKWK